jgi:hypothetical protein
MRDNEQICGEEYNRQVAALAAATDFPLNIRATAD